jgi:hypothetical protein
LSGSAEGIAKVLPLSDWHRLSAGARTKGLRLHNWCYLDLADPTVDIGLTGLIFLWRQPEISADRSRLAKPPWIIDRQAVSDRDKSSNSGRDLQPLADLIHPRDLQHLPMEARELAPQRCPCLKEGADHYLEHGVTVSKLAHTRFKTLAAKARHLIENAFCHLKNFRRIATRYDPLAINFAATIYLAGAVIWWIL